MSHNSNLYDHVESKLQITKCLKKNKFTSSIPNIWGASTVKNKNKRLIYNNNLIIMVE